MLAGDKALLLVAGLALCLPTRAAWDNDLQIGSEVDQRFHPHLRWRLSQFSAPLSHSITLDWSRRQQPRNNRSRVDYQFRHHISTSFSYFGHVSALRNRDELIDANYRLLAGISNSPFRYRRSAARLSYELGVGASQLLLTEQGTESADFEPLVYVGAFGGYELTDQLRLQLSLTTDLQSQSRLLGAELSLRWNLNSASWLRFSYLTDQRNFYSHTPSIRDESKTVTISYGF